LGPGGRAISRLNARSKLRTVAAEDDECLKTRCRCNRKNSGDGLSVLLFLKRADGFWIVFRRGADRAARPTSASSADSF